MEEGQIPDQGHGGAGRGKGHPEGGGDDPVDTVGPPVGHHPRRSGSRGGEGFDVTDGHRGRDHQGALGRHPGKEPVGQSGLGQPGVGSVRSAHRPDDLLGPGFGRTPGRRPLGNRSWFMTGRSAPSQLTGELPAEEAGVGRDHVGSGVVGVAPSPPPIDGDVGGTPLDGGGQEGLDRRGRPALAQAENDLGPVGLGETGGAHDAVGGGYHSRLRKAYTRARLGQNRPAQHRPQGHHGGRIATTGTGGDQPAPCRGGQPGPHQAVDHRGVRGAPGPFHPVPGRILAPTGDDAATGRRIAEKRLPEGQVEVDRPRTAGARQGLGHRPPPQRAPRGPSGGVGHPRVGEPPWRWPEQMPLVDGLGGAHVAPLGRAVGGAGDEGNAREIGLDYRGVQLGRRCPAGRDHQCRSAGGPTDAEGGEPGRALVQSDMDGHSLVRSQRPHQRSGAGSRAHHGVGHAAPHPFVDQGGGEGGLVVGRADRGRYAHRHLPV